MNNNTRTYRFGHITVEDDSGRSPEDIQRAWSTIYPDIANARIIVNEQDNSVDFVVQAGTKGC